jgi:mono/diheme cytochrome c family protein
MNRIHGSASLKAAMGLSALTATIALCLCAAASAGSPAAAPTGYDPDAAARGRAHLTEKSYVPAGWSRAAYDNAWRRWQGVKAKPADYDAAFRDYYGLHPAPFSNNGLPMGLKAGRRLFGPGLAMDCMICHGGSMFGQSYIGLGNASLDIQALFEDLAAADGLPPRLPFAFSRVRGTTEAAAMAVWLLGRRDPDLSLRWNAVELGLDDQLCEDPPAWWVLKKKTTMYWTGGADQRSVRSIMQFMMSPLTPASAFHEAEADFADIRQYLLSIESPKYPFPIDQALAREGKALFDANCARCHGTYGQGGRYPNKIVPLEEIGTDRRRYDGITAQFAEYYNRSWFAKETTGWLTDGYAAKASTGYQVPPLDGIWATAPYFHNGSVPTVYHVLNSRARPKRFTRSFRTGLEDYDIERMGWKTTSLPGPADPRLGATERRRIYDTSQPGRGNLGHFFGDHLTDEERRKIIEFLRTL